MNPEGKAIFEAEPKIENIHEGETKITQGTGGISPYT